MEKKTQGDLLTPCICCYKLKDKQGALQKKLLQDDDDKGTCVTFPKILVGFVLTRKTRRRGL